MIHKLKLIIIIVFSLISSACALPQKEVGGGVWYQAKGLNLTKNNYSASRSWVYVDMPDLSYDIDYPYSYYDDSDFYGFYEMSPLDVMIFFKQKNIISRKLRFSVVNVGGVVNNGNSAFFCSVLAITPISSFKKQLADEYVLTIYIIGVDDGQITSAENLVKPSGITLKKEVSVCQESLY